MRVRTGYNLPPGSYLCSIPPRESLLGCGDGPFWRAWARFGGIEGPI
jgi:hypothetical protein